MLNLFNIIVQQQLNDTLFNNNKLKKKLSLLLLVFGVLVLVTNACKTDKYTQGKVLYDKYCVNCHNENGENLAELIPPLANSDFLVKQKGNLACLIYYGHKGKMTVNGVEYNQQMPANANFNDIDIANVINYINNNFGNDNGYMPLNEVQDALNDCDLDDNGMMKMK